VDYSLIHPDRVIRLSDIIVERCVSRCALLCLATRNTSLTPSFFSQILGVYAALLPPVLRLLRVANCFVCLEYNASRGYVPLLYLPPSNTRRAPPIDMPLLISRPLSRKISRPSPGPKSSDGSELSATLTHSQNSLRLHPAHAPAKALN